MKNFRDIETLSTYLDGQLNAADAARLEARFKTDPELASVINDLRAARGILRKLPVRKAPRNFTLTRQMVGLKPPLPRTYPLFRLATAFAAILFLFSFTATTLVPMLSFGGAAAPMASGYGMGGGGGCEEPCGGGAADTAMEEAAAATEMPAVAQEIAPTMTESVAANLAPSASTEDSTRIMETPSAKEVPTETVPQPEVQQEPAAPSFNWPMLFLVITILGGVILWVMRLTARNKWR